MHADIYTLIPTYACNIHIYIPTYTHIIMFGYLHKCMHIYTIHICHSCNNFVLAEQKANRLSRYKPLFPSFRSTLVLGKKGMDLFRNVNMKS